MSQNDLVLSHSATCPTSIIDDPVDGISTDEHQKDLPSCSIHRSRIHGRCIRRSILSCRSSTWFLAAVDGRIGRCRADVVDEVVEADAPGDGAEVVDGVELVGDDVDERVGG